jgi:hypothetical protein
MVPESTSQEKILRRVLFIAAMDGWSVVVLAILGSLASLLLGDLVGVCIGFLVLAAGIMELRGRRRLQRRDASGMQLMVRAQLFLLSVILVYCVSRLGSFDAETAMGNLTPEMDASLRELGLTRAQVLAYTRTMFYVVYSVVAIVSLLFQGGLALYYRHRVGPVGEALATPPQAKPPSL